MSQHVTRRCDFTTQVGKKYKKCEIEIPSDEPTVFSLDADPYAADLCDKHRMDLQEALAPFIASADPALVNVSPATRRALKALSRKATESDMRRWLVDNGYEVNTLGRLSADLKEAFDLAHANE